MLRRRNAWLGLVTASCLQLFWIGFKALARSDPSIRESIWVDVASQIYVLGLVLSACQVFDSWSWALTAIMSYLGTVIGKMARGERGEHLVVVPMAAILFVVMVRRWGGAII